MSEVYYPQDGVPKLSENDVKSYRQIIGYWKMTPEQKASVEKALDERDILAWNKISGEIGRAQTDED